MVRTSPECIRFRLAGFTLVEMIMVIVILGIVGLASTRIISLSVAGWIDTGERQMLAADSHIVAEKLARELRRALPNSVRVFRSGSLQCVELVPVTAQSDYLDLPVMTASDRFAAVALPGASGGESGYVAVYPHSSTAVYGTGLGPGSAISSVPAQASTPSAHQQTLVFAVAQQFTHHSPTQRFFLTGLPISWCDDGSGNLWQYRDYGFAADSRALLTGSGSNARRMLTGLVPGSFRVALDAAQLQRNAVVNFELVMAEGGDRHPIVREVQLRNVP